MKKSRKIVVGIVLVVVVALMGGLAAKKKMSTGKKGPNVSIAHPQSEELIEFISAPGEVEPKNKVQISAKVSARILELPCDEGDPVTTGDAQADPPVPASVLVRLDAKDLESELRSVRAGHAAQVTQLEVDRARINSQKEGLKGNEASLRQADRDLRRQLELLRSKDVSQVTYDQAKLRFDELKSQVAAQRFTLQASELSLQVMRHNLESAEARIEQAQERLGYTTIYSPIEGVITRLNSKVGEVVTGTISYPGTVIMEVADLSQMLVVAQVGEADIGKLREKQRATVTVQAYPDDEFLGVVDSIALTHTMANTGTKYYRTEILLDSDPNVAKLYSGLTAHVDIETQKHDSVLTLPTQAILGRLIDDLPLKIRDDNPEIDKEKTFTPVVYRYIDKKAVVTPVKIGPSNLTHTIILSGLSIEDEVVVGPYKVLESLKHDRNIVDEREAAKKNDANEPNDTPSDANQPQ
ncbi:MAG: efflux RND transporter periplasmic adaptor subunit [Planctomycetes bacterium]|nr:efflux RND transporter periplasmic adaptor subunit [Planctomycetota bacterium]